MNIKSILKKIRLFVVALLLPALTIIPAPVAAQGFDIWALLDKIATTPGSPYPSDLPTPSQIKGVVNLVEDCANQPPSDLGLIACVEKVLDDPVLGKELPAEKIQLAINIYLDLKAGDYIGLVILLGKPLACIAANVIVGFDVCGALDAIIAVAGAVVDLVKAFIDGLTDFAEWVGSLLGGGSSGSGQAYDPANVLLVYFRTVNATGARLVRLAPDTSKWNEHLQKLRASALSTLKPDGTPIPDLLSIPSSVTVDQAITAYIAEIGNWWDNWYYPGVDGGKSGQDQLRQARSEYEKSTAQAAAVTLYNAADEATRKTLADAQQSKCVTADLAGKALENWQFERGKVNPSRIPNNELNREGFCSGLAYWSATKDGWTQKQKAMKGCTLKPGGDNFDAFVCNTYAGLDSCKDAISKLKSGLSTKPVKVDPTLCQSQSVAAGADFANTLKKYDPKGRCALQPGGKTVTCTRDLSVSRSCKQAIKDYASEKSKPIIEEPTCNVQRDAEYTTLVNQTSTATDQISSAMSAAFNEELKTSVNGHNSTQTDSRFKIDANALRSAIPDFRVQAQISDDPLVVLVTTDSNSTDTWVRSAIMALNFPFGKFTTPDEDDVENDGQNRPAVKFLPPSGKSDTRKMVDRVIDAINKIDKKTKEPLAASPIGQQAAARINPGDFVSRMDPVGQLLARNDSSTRFTSAELSALAGLTVSRSATGSFSYKAAGPQEAATLQKAQAATQQLGLGGFAITK